MMASSTTSSTSSVCFGHSIFKRKTLKTLGSIYVRRKLAYFHSVFPHDDKTTVKNITDIYDDVLEYSRRDLYSESVTRAAWKLIIVQIASCRTYHLRQAVDRWSLVEIQTFLHTLIDKCMTDVEEKYDSLYWKDKGSMLSSSNREVMVLTPALKFMAHLATQGDLMCQTVLEAGILGMMLRIYVVFPALSASLPEDVGRKQALMDACQLIIVVLCRSLERPDAVYHHPVCILWTDRNSKRANHPLQNRCGAWRQASGLSPLRRLVVIYTGSLWKSDIDVVGNIEACIDIVEFTNSRFYDSEIVNLAYLAMLKHIVLNGRNAQHLINVLAGCSYEDTIRIFSGVIHLWLDCIGIQIKNDGIARAARMTDVVSDQLEAVNTPLLVEEIVTDKSFYGQAKKDLWKKIVDVDAALIHVIQFATQAAKQKTTIRLGMLDAGSLVLVLAAFANNDFKLTGLVTIPTKEVKLKEARVVHRECGDAKGSSQQSLPVAAMNAGASTLRVVMRYTAFREFWGDQRFNTRLSLCSSLVDSLLGDEGGSRETRALFKQIFNH